MSKKLGIISLGCDKNRVDTETMLYYLKDMDFVIENDLSKAEIIIINTCAFIESARKEAIDNILEAAEYKKTGLEKLIVTGCLPEKHRAELEAELPEVDAFLGVGEYDKIGVIIERLYNTEHSDVSCYYTEEMPKRILTTSEYAYLKIAEGCSNFCTYCTIPSIRGKYRSRTIESLVSEAEYLTKSYGIKELILVAQDVTSYGIDIYGGYKLIELIRALSALELSKIRLMYCYPELVTDELLREISGNDKVAKYIDIPLQHVDDKILKLMNRKSSFESISSLFERIYSQKDYISVRTTFLVGFPQEEDQQFRTLYDFVSSHRIDHIGIFAFSPEDGTPAFKLKGQIDDKTKLFRVNALGALHLKKTAEQNRKLIGTSVKAVYTDIDYDRKMFVGRTEYNAPDIDSLVFFTADFVEIHKEYDIMITGADGYDLIGEKK